MKKLGKILFIFTLLFAASFLWAIEKEVKRISIDRLLEGTRVTVQTIGSPNIGTFYQEEPPAVVMDIFDAVNKIEPETMKSEIPPVRKVIVKQWKEEPKIVRVTVELDRLYRYRVGREKDFIYLEITDEPFEMRPEKKEEEKTVSLDVKNADIIDVLRMLASLFQVNFVSSPEVKGTITMRLERVPFPIALDAILKAVECNAVDLGGGVIMVKPRKREMEGELATRIYFLNDVEAEDAKKTAERLLSEKGKAELSYRRVGEGGGSKRTSILVVTDIPERLAKIDEVMRELDKPSPQITIEAKFIETTLNADDIYGVDWSIRAAAITEPPEIGKEAALPIMMNEMVLGKITFAQMSAALDLIRSRGKAKLLANPKTLTLDNQTSEITMGVTIPILQVKIDPETRERTYTWQERYIPIALSVTPHLTEDGRINMEIKTRIEAITGWKIAQEQELPIVAKREARTQISVRDGEVIVIGGLVKEQETQSVTKVPILGDIPLLGNLFTHRSTKKEKNELIIFIIPRVLPAEG
ncbi:MAG: AMIN domain-containing protein [candidate division WOR-3 bacterium]